MDILIVGPGVPNAEPLVGVVRTLGHRVTCARDTTRALQELQAHRHPLVIVSATLPGGSSINLLEQFKVASATSEAVVVADKGTPREAVEVIKLGADDYLLRPVGPEDLVPIIRRISERRTAQQQYARERRVTALPIDKVAMVGRSEPMLALLARLERVAGSDAPVLIRGESGTGKELVARWIHQRSPRGGAPFVAVNCAALPDSLVETELFGHERGAFTGATRARKGRFQAAHGGTLFLDEVAEIPLASQVKLLRVLQDKTIEPLGANESVRVDVRILSATHRDLKQRIAEGTFREDLFYRLKVLDALVPPLRQRRGDLPVLVEHFLARFSGPGDVPTLTPRAWAALAQYDFPGNVRELEHAVQHGVVLAGEDTIDLVHLPTEVLGSVEPEDVPDDVFPSLPEAVRRFEAEYIGRALALTDNNRTRAAELLGISRKNLWEKMKRSNTERENGD